MRYPGILLPIRRDAILTWLEQRRGSEPRQRPGGRMTEDGNSLSRRKVIASAGAGVGTGLLAQLAPRPAAAQDPAAKHAAPTKPWSHEYWARKGDVALYMFRKRRTAPRKGEAPLPVLFLVH